MSKDGVIVTVTFHSIEDKICKFFLILYLPINQFLDIYLLIKEDLIFNLINKKVITPTIKEIKINPPSRSAKLRAVKE